MGGRAWANEEALTTTNGIITGEEAAESSPGDPFAVRNSTGALSASLAGESDAFPSVILPVKGAGDADCLEVVEEATLSGLEVSEPAFDGSS